MVTGSRWSVRRDGGHDVWEVVGVEGSDVRLRCVSAVEMPENHKAGDEITVEPAWFTVRGALSRNAGGAVRAVAS